MKNILLFLFLLTSCLTASRATAQSFERTYPQALCADFKQTSDGGFLMVGSYMLPFSAPNECWVQKTDAEGDVEWANHFLHHPDDTLSTYQAVELLDNQYFVALGSSWIKNPPFGQQTFLHKTDASGNIVQEVLVELAPTSGTHYYTPIDMALGADGKLYVLTSKANDAVVFAYNPDLTFSHSFTVSNAYLTQIEVLPNGNLALCGKKSNLMHLHTCAPDGTQLSATSYQSGIAKMAITQDGNIVLAISKHLIKVDFSGNIIWSKTGPDNYWQNDSWVAEDHDGNLIVMGAYNGNFTLVFSVNKYDADGNLIWAKTPYQQNQGTGATVKPLITSDGGYAFAGFREYNFNNPKALLIRSGSDFDLYNAVVEGTIFHDENDNCTQDVGETWRSQFYVYITDANDSEWTILVNDGQYSVGLIPGNYTIAVSKRFTDPENWIPCDAQSVTLPPNATTTAPALGAKSIVDCPRLKVEATINRIRSCTDDNVYHIYCSNYGIQNATNVQVEVELPDFLTYVSSNMTLISQNGQILTFNIGDLNTDEVKHLTLTTACDCTTPVNTTGCASFHITPDDCFVVLPDWDQSVIQLSSSIVNNELSVTMTNIGTGDMAAPLEYQLTNSGTVVYNAGTFQLNAGAAQTLTWPMSGYFYAFEAENPGFQPYVPGNRLYFRSGINIDSTLHYWSTSTGSPFYDNSCSVVRNSYDPNDIAVSPKGENQEGFILNTVPELSYRIRFQNTGNDTAYLVVIRDTLPAHLDPLTVRPGVSSHNYTFDLNNRVVQFRFNDIDLPDSTTNRAASEGFVTFTAKMRPQLEPGTQIDNRAGIYFDFNPPIITNTVRNTIHEAVISLTFAPETASTLRVSPNPAYDVAVLNFDQAAEGRVVVIDLAGKVLHNQTFNGSQYRLDCTQMPAGAYQVMVSVAGQPTVSGKLVVVK